VFCGVLWVVAVGALVWKVVVDFVLKGGKLRVEARTKLRKSYLNRTRKRRFRGVDLGGTFTQNFVWVERVYCVFGEDSVNVFHHVCGL